MEEARENVMSVVSVSDPRLVANVIGHFLSQPLRLQFDRKKKPLIREKPTDYNRICISRRGDCAWTLGLYAKAAG
jgi:hypothetical protein